MSIALQRQDVFSGLEDPRLQQQTTIDKTVGVNEDTHSVSIFAGIQTRQFTFHLKAIQYWLIAVNDKLEMERNQQT